MDAKLPNQFWNDAVTIANYFQNRLTIKGALWQESAPKMEHVRLFGSEAHQKSKGPSMISEPKKAL